MFVHTPTPLQEIKSLIAEKAGIRWFIKRDDLIHPQISGNKWRKLKYNLQQAKNQSIQTVVTFGGAYSNHLYAVAAAGKLMELQTAGIVRGEQPTTLSPTLQFAQSCGMQLAFWPRSSYSQKEYASDFQFIRQKYEPFYLIPEGGSNALAVKGCTEIVDEIEIAFDYLLCACGTGGTAAGLIVGSQGRGKVIGFAALKGGNFLENEIERLLEEYYDFTGVNPPSTKNWSMQLDYHFGGYAKYSADLLAFIRRFEQENAFQIEQVYTAKMLFGIEDMIQKGAFKRGDTLVCIHTGGLQGRLQQLNSENSML